MALADEARIVRYGEQAAGLLPRGRVFVVRPGSTWEALLRGMGFEPANVDQRVADALSEMDTRTAEEMLPEWEHVLGIGDPCGDIASNNILRRYAIFSKLSQQGGQSPAYFVQVALNLGFSISITEFVVSRAGRARAGEELVNMGGQYCWDVHAPELTPQFFRAGEGGAGDRLVDWSNELLECNLGELKPAHSCLFFKYDLPPSGYAPWETLEPDPAVVPLTAGLITRTPGV